MAEHIQGAIDKIKEVVKHGKLKVKLGKVKARVLKDVHDQIPDYEREGICKEARKSAHSATSNLKRDVSNDVKKHLES